MTGSSSTPIWLQSSSPCCSQTTPLNWSRSSIANSITSPIQMRADRYQLVGSPRPKKAMSKNLVTLRLLGITMCSQISAPEINGSHLKPPCENCKQWHCLVRRSERVNGALTPAVKGCTLSHPGLFDNKVQNFVGIPQRNWHPISRNSMIALQLILECTSRFRHVAAEQTVQPDVCGVLVWACKLRNSRRTTRVNLSVKLDGRFV